MSIQHLTVVFVFSKAEFTKFYCLSYSFHKKIVLKNVIPVSLFIYPIICAHNSSVLHISVLYYFNRELCFRL